MASRVQPPLWRETVKAGAMRSSRVIGAMAIVLGLIGFVVALASYHSGDPSFNTASAGPARNWLGPVGAWAADITLFLFGPLVVLMMPVMVLIAMRLWRDVPVGRWRLMLLLATGGVMLMGTTLALISATAVLWLPAGWGGLAGLTLADLIRFALSFIPNQQAMLWTARALGALIGLGGLACWASSFVVGLDGATIVRPLKALADLRERTAERERALEDDEDDYEIEDVRRTPDAPRITVPRAVAMPDDRPAPSSAIARWRRSPRRDRRRSRPRSISATVRNCPRSTCSSPRPRRPAGRSTRPRWSAMRACSNRCWTTSM
jgi:S-DNA-T family DNA segregation ATPase FtsK/SpoIIIE